MWNYTYVIPTLLVLALFVLYFVTLPRIRIRMNRTFIRLILIECTVMISDIISTWADMNHKDFSFFTLYFLNSLYFIAFFARAFYFFVFTASVLKLRFFRSSVKIALSNVPFFIASLIVLFTPITRWFYYMDQDGYHNGPLYNLLYVEFWVYLAMSFYAIFTRADFVRKKKEYQGVFWYNVILLCGTIVRMAFPHYLLMDTFCLLTLIIIYLSFMNPDFYMEGRTWIFNSRALREYLEEINGKKKYEIFAFTIHNYKDLREIYGVKQMDDGVLMIGNYLHKTFPKQSSFYYRNGRFAILCENNENTNDMMAKIQERFKNPWQAVDAELYLDVGCAVLDTEDYKYNFSTIIQLLVDVFNEASLSDKNEIRRVDSSFGEKAEKEIEIKKAIEYAVDHDQVEVFLQPIVDAQSGKLVGAEALARIRDSKGNIISPNQFIPIAERNGRINQLGKQVFLKVCKFINDYDCEKIGLEWINVNLSPIQFMRADLGETLLTDIKNYNVDPDFIHLEITEEAMVDEQLLVYQTDYIGEMGFHFVLDDYGKGYSNFARVRKMSFINIKLDMSIVWDYCEKPDPLIPNMVQTFNTMGFGITAEGIEDETMAKKMRDIGVKYLQGYYFSKALPIEEFVSKYSQ